MPAARLLMQLALHLGAAAKRVSSAVSQVTANEMRPMSYVTLVGGQFHLLLFYLAGSYFLLSNRILGIRYRLL
jgi:hypothetical protein